MRVGQQSLVEELRVALRNLGAGEAQLQQLGQMKTTQVYAMAAQLGGSPELLSILTSLEPNIYPAEVLDWLRGYNEHRSLFETAIAPNRKEQKP